MYVKYAVIFLALAFPARIFAQAENAGYEKWFDAAQLERLDELEDTVALLAYAVINDSLPEHRFGACRQLIPTLVKALKTENSFHYPFDRLKSVSIQYPQDSSFRVFTWQLYVDVNDYRYYGAIQMNSPELKLFPLIDRSFNIEAVEEEILSPENWYGAVYYNLQEFEGPTGKQYLLFGFDGYRFFHKRKLVDVLYFDEKGQPVFGAPVFVHPEEGRPPRTYNRLLLEYSAEASVRCNYDPTLDLLIHDHLVEMSGQYGEGPTKFPDGSYEAYHLKDGFWIHINKVFDQVSEEPPRPYPILDGRGKDIFGRNE